VKFRETESHGSDSDPRPHSANDPSEVPNSTLEA
jgi:hypothetical protein